MVFHKNWNTFESQPKSLLFFNMMMSVQFSFNKVYHYFEVFWSDLKKTRPFQQIMDISSNKTVTDE